MSSSIYLKSSKPVALEDWKNFCNQNGIVYSPNTIGHNVFYKEQVEIKFGKANYDELPVLESGMLDFAKASPLENATEIDVSSFFMSNLDEIVAVAKAIAEYFCAQRWEYQAAPELRRQCKLELQNCKEYCDPLEQEEGQ